LLRDNARPHTAIAAIGALETLKFDVLSHPPYSPDLAPSDFHLFPHLKRDLKGTHFTSDDEVEQAVTSWIKQRTPETWKRCIVKHNFITEVYLMTVMETTTCFGLYWPSS